MFAAVLFEPMTEAGVILRRDVVKRLGLELDRLEDGNGSAVGAATCT